MESIVDAIYRNKVLQKRFRSNSIINSKFQNSRKRLPIFNCKELCLCNNSTGILLYVYFFASLRWSSSQLCSSCYHSYDLSCRSDIAEMKKLKYDQIHITTSLTIKFWSKKQFFRSNWNITHNHQSRKVLIHVRSDYKTVIRKDKERTDNI